MPIYYLIYLEGTRFFLVVRCGTLGSGGLVTLFFEHFSYLAPYSLCLLCCANLKEHKHKLVIHLSIKTMFLLQEKS